MDRLIATRILVECGRITPAASVGCAGLTVLRGRRCRAVIRAVILGVEARFKSSRGEQVMKAIGIGELARRVRLRPSALRYYEHIGLLPPAERVGGRRVYPLTTIRRVALIKMTQRAGFTLAEIRDLLRDPHASRGTTRQWRELAHRKLPELDELIREIQTLREAVASCLKCGCMNFETCHLLRNAEDPQKG